MFFRRGWVGDLSAIPPCMAVSAPLCHQGPADLVNIALQLRAPACRDLMVARGVLLRGLVAGAGAKAAGPGQAGGGMHEPSLR